MVRNFVKTEEIDDEENDEICDDDGDKNEPKDESASDEDHNKYGADMLMMRRTGRLGRRIIERLVRSPIRCSQWRG